MRPAGTRGLMLAGAIASLSGACKRYPYVGQYPCVDPPRLQSERIVQGTFDAASYFSPGLYSSVPFWKPYEKWTPLERRDPNDSARYRTASLLWVLGEESLYARRAEPGLHAYRMLTSPRVGGRTWRAEQRGRAAWIESRALAYSGCTRRSDAYELQFNVEMSERQLPDAAWLAIDRCMEQYFWAVPMVDGEPPMAPKPDVGFDGGHSMCLLEGVRGGEYHAIVGACQQFASAPSRDPFVACGAIVESALR